MMKKILYSVLTLILGLVLSSSGCNTMDTVDSDGIKIGDLIWAKYNVGAPGTFASTPESPGMFYQWNNKTGWSTYDPIQSFPSGSTWSSTGSTATTWEAGNNPCPAGWRVPSKEEFEKLIAFDQGWDTVKVGREYGSGANTIFLRAAGYRSSLGALFYTNLQGSYWTNNESSPTNAEFLSFTSTANSFHNVTKALASSIRCVKK